MAWQNIINRFHQYKKTAGKYSIARLGPFGSFAREEENKNSDINILIDFNNDIGWDYFDLANEIK